jgi:hypothetical protein
MTTLAGLVSELEPLADAALLAGSNREVRQVGGILAVLIACIVPPVDREGLDALAGIAGQIADHRLGRHDDDANR